MRHNDVCYYFYSRDTAAHVEDPITAEKAEAENMEIGRSYFDEIEVLWRVSKLSNSIWRRPKLTFSYYGNVSGGRFDCYVVASMHLTCIVASDTAIEPFIQALSEPIPISHASEPRANPRDDADVVILFADEWLCRSNVARHTSCTAVAPIAYACSNAG